MDETTPSFWNKTAADLTVKDNLIIVAAIPAIMVGSCVVVGAAFVVYDKVANKFWKKSVLEVKTETAEES